MEYKIQINESEWTHNNSIYVRGHVFYENELYVKEELIDLIQTVDEDGYVEFLKRVDGFFSIIIKNTSNIYIITDHVRSFPVFYNTETRMIVDNINNNIIGKSNIDKTNLEIFKSGFYCLSDKTIIEGWNSVLPGSVLFICADFVENNRYFEYKYSNDRVTREEEAIKLLDDGVNTMIEQAIHYLNGRTAVIPLSGGHDSRMLVYLLWKKQYKNIITYSYGIKENEESKVAQIVSNKLNIKHYYVEYKKHDNSLLFQKEFSELCEHQCNASSIPQIQDWFAVWYLKTNQLVPDNSVFMPGHTGDVLAGDYFEEIHKLSDNVEFGQLLEAIVNKHYSFESKLSLEEKKVAIASNCSYMKRSLNETLSRVQAEELFERFNWEERQSKYILNSMRTYSFYGYDFFCPLNYRIMFDTWCSIDNCLRFKRKLLFSYDDMLYSKTPIDNVPFVRLHAKKAKPFHKKAMMIFRGPNYSHYVFTYLNLSRVQYYKMLMKHQFFDINYFMQKKYLSIIEEVSEKNENHKAD